MGTNCKKLNLGTLKVTALGLIFALILGVICGCGVNDDYTINSAQKISEESLTNNKGAINITMPQSQETSVYTNNITFSGSCNKNYKLYINGKAQKIDSDGYFKLDYKLSNGENIFNIENGNVRKTYKVNYFLPMIKSCTPTQENITLESEARFSVTAYAFIGSVVVVTIAKKCVTLVPDAKGEYDKKTYVRYSGIVTLPKKNKNSGGDELIFTASHKDDSYTLKTSKIKIISPTDAKQENPTPLLDFSVDENGFANVGDTYVARIISPMAETFDSDTIDDASRPTNSYLPTGTLDYCSPTTIFDSESGKKYYLLKSNKRIYADDENVKIYRGSLPNNNTISFASDYNDGNRYKIELNTSWRAPFYITYGNQSYYNSKTQNYNISSPTYNYVDINFYYCNEFKGSIDLSQNTIFNRYETIKTDFGYTLRLHLKKSGAFYGWDARYLNNGKLMLSFLKPAKATPTKNNKYGYSLNGIKVLVDAGHGGDESGTYNALGTKNYEKDYNLSYGIELALALKRLGATATMTRIKDVSRSLQSRYNCIRNANANLVVSVHFNGSSNTNASGYFVGYFYPFTYSAANKINNSIKTTGIMDSVDSGLKWHYFNLSRCAFCPVVLTENGYLTNPKDYRLIKTEEFKKQYIDAIVCGIVNYFIEQGE